jgi:hypothetical protein
MQPHCIRLKGILNMDKILNLGMWLVPIAAIVVWGITEVVKTVFKYQERSQLIARGLDPDAPHRNPDAK